MQIGLLLAALLLPPPAFAESPQSGATGFNGMSSSPTTPLSQAGELVHRVAETPLSAARIVWEKGRSELAMHRQAIDLGNEKFVMYVPSRVPPQGRLLVFVPPWADARVPLGWNETLEKSGTIFVQCREFRKRCGYLQPS